MTDQGRNVLILLVFCACLVVASGAYVWRQLRPTPESDMAQVLAPTTDPRYLPPIEAPKLDAPYQQIADRNLFRPLPAAEAEAKRQQEQQEEAQRQRAAASGARSSATYAAGEWELPPPLAYAPPVTWAPPPTWGPAPGGGPPRPPVGPAADPAASTVMPPEKPAGPPATTVSVSGVVTGSDGRKRVLVSDNASGRSMWVEPGGRAFGYTVEYATERGGVLTKSDRTYVLGLGENKAAPKAPQQAPREADSSSKSETSSPTESKGGAQ